MQIVWADKIYVCTVPDGPLGRHLKRGPGARGHHRLGHGLGHDGGNKREDQQRRHQLCQEVLGEELHLIYQVLTLISYPQNGSKLSISQNT